MKHPALSRTFAVVLLILCLVSFLAGLGGLGKARGDYESSQRELTRLREELEEYKTLLAENEGQESYDAQSAALSDLQEQHEETSAEHRTELATYSATKGGIQTGVEALDEADAAMANAKREFEAKKKEFEAQKAAFMEQYNAYQQALAALPGLKDQAAQLELLLASTTPEALEEEGLALEGRAQTLLQEEEALKAEQDPELLAQKQQELEAKKTALEQDRAAYQARLEAYQTAAATFPMLKQQIAGMEAGMSQVDLAQLEAIKAQMDAGALALQEGEKQLQEAENALYHNRALIWYELGKLEDQAAEMAGIRDTLMQESEEIAQKQQQSEEQKLREKRLRSLRLLFAEEESVAAAMEQGEELIPAVEKHIGSFAERAQRDNTLRILACAWMMAALPAGLLCLLSSFELIQKPRLARRGAVLCLLCAVIGMGALWYIGLGLSYAAMGLGIFALLQIFASAPLKKKKV